MFIGVAWPYANGPFHIGHLAGAYLPGEIFARYHRLRGNDVLMVSGSDMHGTPILVTAEKEGSTPEAVARRFDDVNREAFRSLGFTFDTFTNTHTILHERTVQELFLKLLENGYIWRRTEENAYCPTHRRFLPDRYLAGECPHCHFPNARGDECDNCGRVLEPQQLVQPRCLLDGTPAEFRPSEHFYLELDKLAPKLDEFLADKSHWRPTVAKVTENFQRSGLHPSPITRDLDWGVPLPLEGYDAKRFYVWFDAVVGYLSASREWAVRTGRPDAWKPFWEPQADVRQYYFVGKDNIFFHTLIWPSILVGAGGFHLPYDVPANQWLLIEGRKISKSRPAGADAFIPSLLAHYPPDVIRFYAALMAPQNHDTEFDWDEFHQVAEDILSNQYGNLAQRALVLTRERFDGRVPAPPGTWTPEGSEVGRRIRSAHEAIAADLEAVRLKEALDRALTEVREGNRRFHDAKPWQASDEERGRALYETLWLLKAAAIWLDPVLPFSSIDLYRMLGYPEGPGPGDWDEALRPPPPEQRLGTIRPLFPRREPAPTSPAGPARVAPSAGGGEGLPAPTPDAAPPPLAITAAVVREVANHPSADRLYVLQVDVGEPELRTVVAGMRNSYPPEELRGRRVALLANLEPRTIRKVTSQGMVLAAESGERAVLVEPPETVAPGTVVEGVAEFPREIRYEEFERYPLLVAHVLGPDGAGRVRLDVGGREASAAGEFEVGSTLVVRSSPTDAGRIEVITFGPGLPLRSLSTLTAGARVR